MGNWMKAASHKLMEINVCPECVRTPGQGRHLTAVKELRCIGFGGGISEDELLLLRCFLQSCGSHLVWYKPGKLRKGIQHGS